MKFITSLLLFLFLSGQNILAADSFSNNRLLKEHSFISNLKNGEFSSRSNMKIAIYPYPLKGNFMKEGYDSLAVITGHILSNFGTVLMISTKKLKNILHIKKCPYDLLIVPIEVNHNFVEVKDNDKYKYKTGSSTFGYMGSGFFSFEEIDFVAVDCREQKIVWRYKTQKQQGWFIPKLSRKNEITEIGQLTHRLKFNKFAQQMSFRLNVAIKKLFVPHKKKKRYLSRS